MRRLSRRGEPTILRSAKVSGSGRSLIERLLDDRDGCFRSLTPSSLITIHDVKTVLMCLGLLACKRSEMMPPIPDATTERWSNAMATICDAPQVKQKRYEDNPIATSEVRISCTPKEEWGGAEQQHTGAMIQLDDAGRPNRMEVQAFTGHGRAMALARRVLETYGLRPALIERVMAQSGDDRSLAGDGMRIFVNRISVPSTSSLVSIDVTIDAQDVSDRDPVREVVR